MLAALFDGRELSAGELAYSANVAPNAASAHLAKLVAGTLLAVRAQGRRKLFRLANSDVARALEALTALAPAPQIVALSQSRISEELRAGRTCYDHLAGRLGVAVTQAFVERKILLPASGAAYRIGETGTDFFTNIGVDMAGVRASRRHFARQCLDWSERRPHLAGALGAALHDVFFAGGWIERTGSSRAVRLRPAGREWLFKRLGVDLER